MRILLTNDDGIHAEGLQALKEIALDLTDDVWIVAPETNQSGVAHALTLHTPLRNRKIDDKTYAVSGTPTDCVLMAILQFMTDKKPDLVMSGINRGRNAADDITYSGTIAGAIEGTMLGVPSIALSLKYGTDETGNLQEPLWHSARKLGTDVIRTLLKEGWPKDVFLNINFPDCEAEDCQGVAITTQGHRDQTLVLKYEERFDMSQTPYYWLYYRRARPRPKPGTDLEALQAQKISITPLHLDLTHTHTINRLKKLF